MTNTMTMTITMTMMMRQWVTYKINVEKDITTTIIINTSNNEPKTAMQNVDPIQVAWNLQHAPLVVGNILNAHFGVFSLLFHFVQSVSSVVHGIFRAEPSFRNVVAVDNWVGDGNVVVE